MGNINKLNKNSNKFWNDGKCFFIPVQEKDDGHAARMPPGFNVYVCILCNIVTAPTKKLPEKIGCKCEKAVLKEFPPRNLKVPGIIQKLGRYGVSYLKHIAKGRKESTTEQIRERYAICRPCKYFLEDTNDCIICGCAINLLRASEGRNKLAWADTECGDKPQRWKNLV